MLTFLLIGGLFGMIVLAVVAGQELRDMERNERARAAKRPGQ